jgi:hypothetical protein
VATEEDRTPDTVTEALQLLRSEGYTAEYELVDGVLRADSGTACSVDEVAVERLYRFEGPSDPGDEMIVFALCDPLTSTRGTLAAAFGHSADPDLYQHLGDLTHRFT